MSLDQCVALVSALIAFGGFVLLATQIRDGNKQQRLQALLQIHAANNKLVILAIRHPELQGILKDDENVNADLERWYLQLWLNLFLEAHTYFKESVIITELKDSMLYDSANFLMQRNMQRHWARFGSFYPVSFQKFVNKSIERGNEQAAATVRGGSNETPQL